MKKVAIIGSNGMLGSDLVLYLGPKFHITPITKENYTRYIGKSFDIIINANGNSKRFWGNKHHLDDFNASTTSVYKSIVDFKFDFYIHISSPDVYERHDNKKYTLENRQINPDKLSPYGLHKYISEIIVQNRAKHFLILRCSMLLGKNLKKGPIYDIFHQKKLFIAKSSRIQMITTEEMARVIDYLIGENIDGEIFNVGGRGIVSFENIHKFIKKPIKFLKNGEQQKYEMNIEKLHKLYKLKSSEYYLQQFLLGVSRKS